MRTGSSVTPSTSTTATLYGTTYYGGASGDGTVFRLNTDGSGYAVLKNFSESEGSHPAAGLLLAGLVLFLLQKS